MPPPGRLLPAFHSSSSSTRPMCQTKTIGRSFRRKTVTAAAAAVVLLAIECAAFAPPPPRGALACCNPRIRPRCTALQQTSVDIACEDKVSHLQRGVASIGTSAAIVAATLFSPLSIHVDQQIPHAPAISIERSQALALTENQQFVADVWFAVSAQYFDQSFNGLGEEGWRAKEKEAIQAVADTGPDDDELVESAIKTMLSALDDPYTRYLPPQKYEALTAYATGRSSAGIGVQLLEDPRTKNVMVMATTAGGPAEKAGVRAGDVILKIDEESMEGVSAEVVAAKCRGESGGKVDVDYLRMSEDGKKKDAKEHVTLTRAIINANPIQASTFVSDGGKRVGLLRVPSFSTETVSQMVDALRSVQDDKVDAIAIDIRGNVGGYMPAGVDAAKLFLPARAHIIAEVGKSGSSVKAYDADGIGAETSMPVYLLVDKRTASASEIFAAALQDNRRAFVVGTTNTFGKGRIQNVQPLENGSGVAVTRARYITPRGRDIHGVGVVPNKEPGKCEANDSAKLCLSDIVDMY